MPVENPEPTPQEQPRDDWHQLARDAAQHWDLEHPGVAALYENHVVPKLHDKGLGHLALTAEDKAGGRFVHKYASVDPKEVDHVVGYLRSNGETILDKAGDRTATYLKFMADTAKDGILTGDPESVRRQIDAHVIKAKDVPESHFALQRQIARNQGHGDIEITSDMKRQLIEAAQADQRASLEKWVEYLGGNDGSYPDWFKTYAWQGITSLGKYNKETQKFARREADTVAPYPELSREALAYTYAAVKNFHVLGEKPDDAKLQQVLKEGSFGRLYTHAILEVTPDNPELRQDIRGSWTKYHQTTDPRTARRLAGSLQGHGTDWCTAGEPTAAMQLQGGDFYVYYTRDEDGKDTIPRLAIRMENGVVSHDVRGVLPGQDVEPVLYDTLSEKLQDPDLPGGEEYLQKAADMKRLTAIDNLFAKDPNAELSTEDIAFLYELNHSIEGFGYDDDPRVQELQLKAANARTAELLEQIDANADMTRRVRHHARVRDLMTRAGQDEFSEFSDDDLCFIYGLDGPIQTLDPNDTELGKSIDYWHGGRDRERLLELMPGAFERQYQTAMKAYEATAQSLGIETADTETLQREFATKLATWQEQDVYQYVLEQLIEQDTQFNLVMTPNILASPDQVTGAAEAFSQGQPYTTYVYRELYSQYSGEELSGAVEQGVSARFSLMPSKYSQELGSAPVEEQRTKLQQLRESLPGLSIRIPSVLEAISYWQSLRARGDALSGGGTTQKTYIRHLDLAPKRFGSWSSVPNSYVSGGGGPYLSDSLAGTGSHARVLVG